MTFQERVDKLSDWANPIVVKELRQAVRSRSLVGTITLFLVLQIVCVGVVLATTALETAVSGSPALVSAGRTMFQSLFVVLLLATMLMVPAMTSMRFASENQKDNVDLLFITAISRSAIIRGKLWAACVLTLVIFSTCLPFMAFSYMLRGIDLPSIFITLLFAYVVSVMVNQMAILAGALSTNKILRGVMGFVFAIFAIYGLGSGGMMGVMWVQEGIGSRLGTWDFWLSVLLFLGVVASGTALIHVTSISAITPPALNRALPVRITVVALWLAWLVVAVVMAITAQQPEMLLAWGIPSLVIIGLMFFPAISEREGLSLRVRKSIPRQAWGRRLAFLFYNGPAGGVQLCEWMAFITIAICLCFGVWADNASGFGSDDLLDASLIMSSFACYVLDYGLIALMLKRGWLARMNVNAGTLALILMGLVPAIMMLILATTPNVDWNDLGPLQLGNVLAVWDKEYREMHLIFSAGLALLLLIINSPWFRAQLASFRHPDDEPARL